MGACSGKCAKGAAIKRAHSLGITAKFLRNWATLEEADIILLAGEAGSHCVANTVRDIASSFSDPSTIRKMVLLTDAISPVPGFEQLQTDFVRDLTALGLKTTTTSSFLAAA